MLLLERHLMKKEFAPYTITDIKSCLVVETVINSIAQLKSCYVALLLRSFRYVFWLRFDVNKM